MVQRFYIRVGPSGAGHTDFIQHLSNTCNLRLFSKQGMTPKKYCYGPGGDRFCSQILKCKQPKMLAFNDCRAKDMCRPSPIVYNFGSSNLHQDLHTVVFSVNDKGMKSCGEVDADDILKHAFPNGAFEAHSHMLYQNIFEIHHMLTDGTVRIMACGGKKLQDPLMLTKNECLARETAWMCV